MWTKKYPPRQKGGGAKSANKYCVAIPKKKWTAFFYEWKKNCQCFYKEKSLHYIFLNGWIKMGQCLKKKKSAFF